MHSQKISMFIVYVDSNGDDNGDDLHCPSPQFGSSWSCKRRLPEASEIALADILEHGAEPL